MSDRLVRTSKFLSYVLRHEPEELGLSLDPGGWADVDTLIERAQADGRSMSRSLIEHAVAAGEKSRFTLSDDGSMIRANYGHSIDVNLDLEPASPPERLYHGTTKAALSSIRDEGLKPQSRQYVHLSNTREDARRVSRRHGPPVVLVIDAVGLHDANHALYRSTDAVWLTQGVPAAFIQFPTD